MASGKLGKLRESHGVHRILALGKKIWFFVPSFKRFGLIPRVTITIFIAGLCMDIFYAKINPALPLLKGALTFSPVPYAQSLVDKGHLKTAEEYIEFYTSIPGASASQELLDLQKAIYDERHGIISGSLHQIKHAYKGIRGEESDELIASAADVAIEFTGASDVRDLYTEWHNYSEGREVDKLSAGLAGIGLAMTLGELAPGAIALCAPVKNTVLGIKKSLKIMNPRLRKATMELFEPVFMKIVQLKLFEHIPSLPAGSWTDKIANLRKFLDTDAWKTFFHASSGKIAEIAKLASSKLGSLGDVTKLARENPIATKIIVQSATTEKALTRAAKWALELGEKGKAIFQFGGKNALNALETLGKQGRVSADTLKRSMRVGPTGLKAVARGCWKSLDKMLALIQKFAPFLWWFMLQWFLAKIPFLLALLLELAGIAILAKTWLPRFINMEAKSA